MKTPIQELIEQIKEERDGFLKLPPHSNIQERTENCFGSCIEIAERMLEKEKEQIVNAWIDDRFPLDKDWVKQCAEQYYNETYGGNK